MYILYKIIYVCVYVCMASMDAGEARLTRVNHDTEIGKGLKSLVHQINTFVTRERALESKLPLSSKALIGYQCLQLDV